MRIIAGDWRSRKLAAPPGSSTRPTADRTRETLFSMLASRLGSFEGLRIADLYAGSGALGFEALSRGADHCLFVDRDPAAQRTIRDNADAFGCSDRIEIGAALPAKGTFDLIFADPPYGSGDASRIVGHVLSHTLLAQGGWMALETAHHDPFDASAMTVDAERRVGRALIRLLRLPRVSSTPS